MDGEGNGGNCFANSRIKDEFRDTLFKSMLACAKMVDGYQVTMEDMEKGDDRTVLKIGSIIARKLWMKRIMDNDDAQNLRMYLLMAHHLGDIPNIK
jgi:hypothetical protein